MTGLDYAVNRHYDPLQGRFTQVDPIGMASASLRNPQTLNLYAYCANDPINHADPSGLGFFSFLGKIFGAIGKALHFVAEVLAVVAAVMVVVSIAIGLPGGYAIAFAVMSGILFASAYGPPIVGKLLSAAGAAARRVTVAGTPPINPRGGGTGLGPISSFQQGQGPQIGPAPPDKTTWFGLFVDWIFSRGSKDRQFGPDSDITKRLRTSPGVGKGRLAYCAKVANGGPTTLAYFVNFKIMAGIWGDDGYVGAFFSDSMTRQFVGSFTLTMEAQKDGTVAFTAVNSTSLKSGLYHIFGVQNVKPGEGPFATQKQTYWWTEANPCGNR